MGATRLDEFVAKSSAMVHECPEWTENMAAVTSARIIEGAARAEAFAAGRTLLNAGAVTELESFDGGDSGLIADRGGTHHVWAGTRYQFLVHSLRKACS